MEVPDFIKKIYPFQKLYVFEVNPCSAPRMTRSDIWKTNANHPDPRKRQRPVVAKWFAYERTIQALSLANKFKLNKCLNIHFFIPMSDSWSKKKKIEKLLTPHDSTPDIDNLLKGFMDASASQDNYVYKVCAEKTWSEKGYVVVWEDLF